MAQSDSRAQTNLVEPRPATELTDNWADALAGSDQERLQWNVADGGDWTWQPDGVHARGKQWLSFRWEGGSSETWRTLDNFSIEVEVRGKAVAAGLSFGHYKDFLVPLDSEDWPRRLQLEIDIGQKRWTFRADGRLVQRCWWDADVKGIDDLLSGRLHLKAHGAESVLFNNLRIYQFAASCRLSIIITCNRFIQRLRVSLRNWIHQRLPAGTHEIIVVNPQSPDGTHEHLAAVACAFPTLRLRELQVSRELATNKGAMINRALAESCGEIIWLTDADCLFPTDSVARVLSHAGEGKRRLLYGSRRYLNTRQTARLLSGECDGVKDFDELTRAPDEKPPVSAPWGYTQIVHRTVLERIRYNEQLNHYADSDNAFVLECRRQGITPEHVPNLFCLHLAHPFTWYGFNGFL